MAIDDDVALHAVMKALALKQISEVDLSLHHRDRNRVGLAICTKLPVRICCMDPNGIGANSKGPRDVLFR